MPSDVQHGLCLLAVTLGILATGLTIVPVSIHRLLFRKQERAVLVRQADLLAKLGLTCLGLCLTTSVTLIASIVLRGPGALVAAVPTTGARRTPAS